MNDTRKSRLVAGLVLVLVLVAGIAIGFFLHQAAPWRHGPPGFGIGGPPPGRPGAIKDRMLARLDRELKLTPSQHATIDTVLTRREADLRALMAQTRPRFDSIAARTRTDIQAVLTAQQRDDFAKIVQEVESRRRGREGDRAIGR
jgi:Spy/CpxP family protein refolding chaperone